MSIGKYICNNLLSYKKIYQNSSLFVCLMLSNATFNNISLISWLSVLLVKETGVTGENYRPVARH